MILEKQIISTQDILCIIPMKDIHLAKKRLRISFPNEKHDLISNIIIKLFLNTIDFVKPIYDFAVVSPSDDILEIGLEKGASFIYQDFGIDLNDALTTSISYAYTASKWKYVLILTADLPYLSSDSLTEIQKYFLSNSFTIISAPEKEKMQGTSGLLIPLVYWDKINLQFGQNSCFKFKKQFTEKNLDYFVVQNVHTQIGFDLDTLDDLLQFKKDSPNSFSHLINDSDINQLLT